MAEIVRKGRLLKWGNSFGIRLSKSEVESGKLKPGREYTLRIETGSGRIDLSNVHFFRDTATDVSERHDEYLGDALVKEWEARQRAARRRH